MTYTDCPNHPPGHVWDNGLTCRWCDATRTPGEAIVSGLASRRGGTEDSARVLLDAYRSGVLTEVTTWLIKKAREFWTSGNRRERERGDTAAMLASKISRGAVRPDNLRMLPNAGFFEVDRTYTREHHASTIRFLVRCIDEPPDGLGGLVAFGWRTEDGDVCSSPFDSDDFTGWTDVTEAGGGSR